MTTSAEDVARTPRPLAILQPLPDQVEHWITQERPLPFSAATQLILDAHQRDGAKADVVAHQLRTLAFGSSDGRTMELTRVPFEGREQGEPLRLRDLAFSQLCARIGAPPPYVRSLPMRLQVACMNWGIVHQPGPALLRLAGREVRAIVSGRYAAVDDDMLLEMIGDLLDRCGYRDDAQVRAVAAGPHTHSCASHCRTKAQRSRLAMSSSTA